MIPSHIIFDILAKLPVKSLLRFKCVCKEWHTLIKTSSFIQQHLNNTTAKLNSNSNHEKRPFFICHKKSLYLGEDIDSPSAKQLIKLRWSDSSFVSDRYEFSHIVGSCNGLVCLRQNIHRPDEHLVVCNPSTRTFREVRGDDINLEAGIDHRYPVYGFGYDARNDDYKIFLIKMGMNNKCTLCHIWRYSLKANSWKKCCSSRLPSPFWKKKIYVDGMCSCYAVFGHGILHCVVGVVDGFNYNNVQISRFNVSSEEWEDSFRIPIHEGNDNGNNGNGNPPAAKEYSLVEPAFLNGYFCISTFDHSFKFDMWIMKEYGVESSWTKLFRSDLLPECCRPIAFSRTSRHGGGGGGGGLWFDRFVSDNMKRDVVGLARYDLEQETIIEFKDFFKLGRKRFDCELMVYVPSLVSIPDSSHMFEEEFQAEQVHISSHSKERRNKRKSCIP